MVVEDGRPARQQPGQGGGGGRVAGQGADVLDHHQVGPGQGLGQPAGQVRAGGGVHGQAGQRAGRPGRPRPPSAPTTPGGGTPRPSGRPPPTPRRARRAGTTRSRRPRSPGHPPGGPPDPSGGRSGSHLGADLAGQGLLRQLRGGDDRPGGRRAPGTGGPPGPWAACCPGRTGRRRRARPARPRPSSCRSRWVGRPKSTATCSTPVRTSRTSAPSLAASRAEARSLSTTASTPAREPSARRTTGIPPPPAATTTAPVPAGPRSGRQLQDLPRLRGGDHPAPAPAGVLPHHPALGVHAAAGLRLVVEVADRLGGSAERRVAGVDHRAGDHADRRPPHPRLVEGVVEALLEHEAHAALGVGHAGVQGQPGQHPGGQVAAEQQVADLGAVAVGHDQRPLGQVGQVVGGLHGPLVLRRDRAGAPRRGDGVPAQCHHDKLLAHALLLAGHGRARRCAGRSSKAISPSGSPQRANQRASSGSIGRSPSRVALTRSSSSLSRRSPPSGANG